MRLRPAQLEDALAVTRWHVRSRLYGTIQLTHISHPGYNRDGGPIWVPDLRLHIDF